MKRTILAYSGSLAGSAAIVWLQQQHQAEVVTVTLDFGQDRELAAVRAQALALGAVRAHVIDVREQFVQQYLLPALQAGALSDGYALSRPLIARRIVELARMESAPAVAHAALPGTDVEAALSKEIASLGIEVLTPAREMAEAGEEPASIVRARGVHAPSAERYRVDASAWGRRIVRLGGDPLPEDAFTLTRAPEEGPDHPAIVEIEFQAGIPVRTNGVELSMTELMESLETIAGAHGVGRRTGEASAAESPAATVLAMAHRELERNTLGEDLALFKEQLARLYADAMVSGRWFSDVREAIDAFVTILQKRVTGTATVRLLKGQCVVVGCAPAGSSSEFPTVRPRKVVA
jgi:argininosuccinate synthase